MNVNIRETGSHVEFEPSSYYAAFSCELEASAYPMWSIISHLKDPSHAPLAKKIMLFCVNYLQDWLDAVNFYIHPKFDKEELYRASFHFPLHRYLAAFICQGVKTMGMSLSDILPSADLLPMLMMHPLRVQVSRGTFLARYSTTGTVWFLGKFWALFKITVVIHYNYVEPKVPQRKCLVDRRQSPARVFRLLDRGLHVGTKVVRHDLGRDEATELGPTLVEEASSGQGHGFSGNYGLGVEEGDRRLGGVHAAITLAEPDELVADGVRDGLGGGEQGDVRPVQLEFGSEIGEGLRLMVVCWFSR